MTDVQKALADLKARQEAGEHMPCPRCGRDTMKPALYTNALSRVADGIMVCDDCGTQEALLAFMQNPMPVDEWAFLNPDLPSADFKDLPGKAVVPPGSDEAVPRADTDLGAALSGNV